MSYHQQSHRAPLLALALLAGVLLLAGCGAVDTQTVRNVARFVREATQAHARSVTAGA